MVASRLRVAAAVLVAAATATVMAAPPMAAPRSVPSVSGLQSAPSVAPRDLATLTPPSRDAFYRVPDGLSGVKPGTILRHRRPPNPIAAFGIIPLNLKDSHQLLYRTTDSLGNATATVVTVLVPFDADYGKVLSYQVAEDAASIDCSPSYAFQLDHARGPGFGTILTEAELLLVEAALQQGWIVIVPDFLGPKAAFLANELAGQATLDGIRAAINSEPLTGISSRPRVAMWGYSGGSLASLWAAELQPTYAPELGSLIAGAAVGGTVPNISSVVNSINKGPSAGLIPAGMVGLANQHADLDALLQKHVLPQYKDEFFSPRRQCFEANNRHFANKDVAGMLDDPTLIFRNPLAVALTAKNKLGNATPEIPLFVYKSTKDEISPVAETDTMVRKYCAKGTSVEYVRDRSFDHTQLAIAGAPGALIWLRDTLNGRERRGQKCVTRTVLSSLLDPRVWLVLPKILVDALLGALGKRIGPPFS
ncbi:Secretory lipase family protein [Ophiocordyceps camponoti-floridani]|uniref:Secretory lipase family protein n=1 Tax=Ophiocordyceps camponoti-floridani TaxID=2030778 RepID=A0A8H4QB99_9HYPO|nr:Secretory lipase family protein [Ophiocordyceps camponoti-floridani]